MKWLLAVTAGVCLSAAETPAEFFETKVRPVLAKNCFSCHTQTKLGGLAMASREDLLKGGKTGPAIVSGDPEKSLLVLAITHQHERFKMPPSGAKMDEVSIGHIKQWIRDGAVFPEGPGTKQAGKQYIVTKEQRQWWAFQPVKNPAPPAVKNKAWGKSPIDAFILAALEAKDKKGMGPADRRTLIRRATLDLTGLPPTASEIDAFLADKSPDAFAKVVDRLLASPHYGERWGRVWLDVARYSDDKLNSTMDEPRPNAFRYRDWVVQAFNKDMPYDTFVKAQIAGDLLGKPELIAGTGLYGLSPEFQDDRVDVTTRGFLALTVACAQCHDHKFDPIPTKDYYSLLGVFNSSKQNEYPLADKEAVEAWTKKKKELDKAKEDLTNFYAKQTEQLSEIFAAKADKYLLAAQDKGPYDGLDGETIQRFRNYLKKKDRLAKIADSPAVFRAELIAVQEEKKQIDEKNNIRLGGSRERGDLSQADLLSLAPDKFYLWRDFYRNGGVFNYGPGKIDRFIEGQWREHLGLLKQIVETAEKALPEQYPFLHAMADNDKPKNEHIYIRGNRANLGEEAPRGWLTILSPEGGPPRFEKGSGRLELAERIANKNNPLTARVMVNRIWQGHFGEGIVRSTSNFGRLGEAPSHPELLDWLATKFMEKNWSIKAMHREIMLSSTYQMATGNIEGENRLLEQFPARRLDAESLRDSILSVSGRLNSELGGKAFPLEDVKQNRRTVYGYVSRRRTDTMLNLFDFPNPNATSEKRVNTDVPLQRLFLLNSSLMADSAEALDKKVEGSTPSERIQNGYRAIFGRTPTKAETDLGVQFTKAGGEAWPEYWQVLMATDEFLMVR
ncbi:MAG TPA: PSD1 and planctomycete cytochrome C domain-containing protein [Bryobacteraceae bacterium]|nr:PSD1 and planctomycete cytochrome C domain-containing protein [Bryobacteraceae bacterium]